MELGAIQAALTAAGLDGWLFYDFRNRDPIGCAVLGLDAHGFTTRRWFYLVPARGDPVRLVHRVESTKLDALPGRKASYLGWEELQRELRAMLSGLGRVAMQYSPGAALPVVSTVDAGTVELVRSMGVEVCSSADLVQRFEALVDDEGILSHVRAGELIHHIKDQAFVQIQQAVQQGVALGEHDLQQWILGRFEECGLDCEGEPPIVGVNAHPADPHFAPTAADQSLFKGGDTVLIDLWARLAAQPGSIYYDITWCGFVGARPPAEYVTLFEVVCRARDRALEFLRERLGRGQEVRGFEVDRVCRAVVQEAGYGSQFVHRTGHCIGTSVHGNGANLDDLETHDERRLVPGSLFSIEPGIYLDGRMAVRTEVDAWITSSGAVEVAGPIQQSLVLIEV